MFLRATRASWAVRRETSCWRSAWSNASRSRSLFHTSGSGLGGAAVLVATAAGSADRPDEFSVYNNWNAAFDWDCTCESKNTETLTASSDRVLERLRRAAEQ